MASVSLSSLLTVVVTEGDPGPPPAPPPSWPAKPPRPPPMPIPMLPTGLSEQLWETLKR